MNLAGQVLTNSTTTSFKDMIKNSNQSLLIDPIKRRRVFSCNLHMHTHFKGGRTCRSNPASAGPMHPVFAGPIHPAFAVPIHPVFAGPILVGECGIRYL